MVQSDSQKERDFTLKGYNKGSIYKTAGRHKGNQQAIGVITSRSEEKWRGSCSNLNRVTIATGAVVFCGGIPAT